MSCVATGTLPYFQLEAVFQSLSVAPDQTVELILPGDPPFATLDRQLALVIELSNVVSIIS